jgi:hypothetical protein
MVYRPTLMQRLWRRLGFGRRWNEALFDWRSADPQPGDWFAPGVLTTRTVVHIDWRDRLRILVSGRCEVTTYTRTDVGVDRVEARSQFSVLPPAKASLPSPPPDTGG